MRCLTIFCQRGSARSPLSAPLPGADGIGSHRGTGYPLTEVDLILVDGDYIYLLWQIVTGIERGNLFAKVLLKLVALQFHGRRKEAIIDGPRFQGQMGGMYLGIGGECF